jgi:mono/diheme cytochrome c family protein
MDLPGAAFVLVAGVIPLLAGCGEGTPEPAPASAPPEAASPTVPVVVEDALRTGECLTCHVIHGRGVPLGPSLTGAGSRLGADRIREKILNPAAFAVEGYENLAGTMPSDLGDRLSTEELEALVRYLAAPD